MIGIEFKRENKYGNFLIHLLNNIEFSEYNFFFTEQEMYYINAFDDVIQGEKFKKILVENTDYYVIFLNMQVYLKDNKMTIIEEYTDFLESDCELMILINDAVNVEIYFKDNNLKKQILKNLKQMNVKYNIKTIDNDGRYAMHVN